MLAVGEERFQLRIAFEASRHVAHRRACGPVAGDVARLIPVQTGLVELLPVVHEAVGATARIDAQFGLKLERADGAVEPAASRLVGKIRVLLVGGFGIVRAKGAYLLEDLTGLLQFLHLLGTCIEAHLLHIEDRIHGAGMADERPGTQPAQFLFRLFRQLPFRRFGFAPLGLRTAPFPFRRFPIRPRPAIRAGRI